MCNNVALVSKLLKEHIQQLLADVVPPPPPRIFVRQLSLAQWMWMSWREE